MSSEVEQDEELTSSSRMLDSHVFEFYDIFMRQELEQFDFSEGGDGELGAVRYRG